MTFSMSRRTTRRHFINTALAGAASLSLPAHLARAATPSLDRTPLTVHRLSDTLRLFQGAGGNVVAMHAAEGVTMVDGGLAERSVELLKLVAAEFSNRPVKALCNTHWHWDHTGSNEALAKRGATIVAHENTKLWLSAEIISKWENKTYPPRPLQALPTQTFFYDVQKLSLGNESIEYGLLPQAHTDGDIYVFLPNQNVLVAGDVVTGGRYPILDYSSNGWLGGMINGLRSLLKRIDANTRIVPGTGPLRTRADVQSQLDMCLAVIGRIGDNYHKGKTWDEFIESKPTKEFDAQWGNSVDNRDLFLHTAYEGAWVHVNETRRFR